MLVYTVLVLSLKSFWVSGKPGPNGTAGHGLLCKLKLLQCLSSEALSGWW